MEVNAAEKHTRGGCIEQPGDEELVAKSPTDPINDFKVVDVLVNENVCSGGGGDAFYPRVIERGVEESISSSCCSRKSKLRLYVEMNIQHKAPSLDKDQEGWGSDVPAKKDEPISVIVDYPDDVVVSVNARIVKNEDCRDSTDTVDKREEKKKESHHKSHYEMGGDGGNEMLNSTFVKVPFTSTFIYPILEETEVTGVMGETKRAKDACASQSQRKSGESSVYHTVIGGNDTMFGNLSSISKSNIDGRNLNEPERDFDFNPNNMDLQNHPSLNLNCRSRVFPSDKLTPAEKLIRALHILARYRGAWGVFEDEGRILKHLISLNGLLTITDNTVIQNICAEEDFRELNGLISYFALEKRFVIRSELLQTFSILSNKSPAVAAAIFESEIPFILAGEIAKGDYTSRETYDYALFFLHVLGWGHLSEGQCESIGPLFYAKLIAMIDGSEKNHFEHVAEVLLQLFLKYHGQLRDDTDIKWQCLQVSSQERFHLFKNLKQKFIHFIVKNASITPEATGEFRKDSSDHHIKNMLRVLQDLMVCGNTITSNLFSNAELDILLVTLTHALDRDGECENEAWTTIYRILKIIKTEPSGIDRLMKLVKRMLVMSDAAGDHCNRSTFKKIYKILHSSC